VVRGCFDVGVRFKVCAVSPHTKVILVLFGERGHGADLAIAIDGDATTSGRVQLLVVFVLVIRVATFLEPVLVIRNRGSIGMEVAVFPFWVVVVQQPTPPKIFLVVRVLFHHEELVVLRVRAAMHPAQIDRVIDVCPKVGPLVKVLEIGEVSAPVGIGEGFWYTVGLYYEDHVWWR
jgi:hypothetical protein